jgi:CheY-like chemotaxis protein
MKPKKILIIEDQAPMRRKYRPAARNEGFQSATAANGAAGFSARKEKPDLILCDVMMPEMDGYAVVQALRAEKDSATTPFIFLTAKGDRSDVRVGMNFGADDYLTKPVIREDLLAAVHARLARAQAVGSPANTKIVSESAGFKPTPAHPPRFNESSAPLHASRGPSLGGPRQEQCGRCCILGMSERQKQHMGSVSKIGVEGRNGATVRAHSSRESEVARYLSFNHTEYHFRVAFAFMKVSR